MSVNYLLNTVGSDVEGFTNFASLRQATSDNTSPIPGYLFDEINAMTYERDGNHCKTLINYFASRLDNKSPHVKIKVLKLLVFLVKNGHRCVIDELRIHELAVKQISSFNIPMGDADLLLLCGNIRKLSKELLSFVFSEDRTYELSSTEHHIPGSQKLSGIGCEASSNKMAGFGNTAFTESTLGERISKRVTKTVEKILSPNEGAEYYKQQAKVLNESLPSYQPVSVPQTESFSSSTNSNFAANQAIQRKLFTQVPEKVHIAGKAGGGWEDSDDEAETYVANRVPSTTKDSTHCPSLSQDSLEETEFPTSPDWQEEQKLVDEFSMDEPLTAIKFEQINSLCKKSITLNCDKICEFLVEKISSSNKENVKLRCLIILEYMIHNDVNFESVISITLPLLKQLAELEESSIQIKSKKLCLIIQSLCNPQTSPIGNSQAPLLKSAT